MNKAIIAIVAVLLIGGGGAAYFLAKDDSANESANSSKSESSDDAAKKSEDTPEFSPLATIDDAFKAADSKLKKPLPSFVKNMVDLPEVCIY